MSRVEDLIRGVLLTAMLVAACGARSTSAADAALDLDAWRRLPVFDNGRVMPLDTFARTSVDTICGRMNPTLQWKGYVTAEELKSDEFAGARELLPADDSRRFEASELLLSWLVEPEKWEHVPFLMAKHEDLRKLLGVPLRGPDGEPLMYVSPAQVADSDDFLARLRELDRQQRAAAGRMEKQQFSGVDKRVNDLWRGYLLFRQLTYQPLSDEAPRGRFLEKASAALKAWSRLQADLEGVLSAGDANSGLSQLVAETNRTAQALIEAAGNGRFPLPTIEPTVATLCASANRLATHFGERNAELHTTAPADLNEQQLTAFRARLGRIANLAREFAKQADQAHLALYDNGESLRIVPALNPAALDKDRDVSDDAQPWLTLQTVLVGSPALLQAYPQRQLEAARDAFHNLALAYRNRDDRNRGRDFDKAEDQFVTAVRALGTEATTLREKMEIPGRDERLLAYTAYPDAESTHAEVIYNHLDPFMWSWGISFVALLCFGLSFGAMRKAMFWLGMAVLAAGLLWSAYGFYLRICVTHWAPVTGMYETVIYVPLFVSLLGAWFTLLPINWPGLKNAWRLSAIPGTWEAHTLTYEQTDMMRPTAWSVGGWLLLLPRLALMSLVFYVLAVAPYAAAGRTIINRLPQVDSGQMLPDANKLLVWAVGLCVLLPAVWYVPRVLLAALSGVVFVPWTLRRQSKKTLSQIYPRWPFAVAATFVAFAGAFIAWYSPVLDRNFSPLQPVLRDNFWLTIHVLTIVSSYGAGALAWGLGLLSLGFYLFGKYRDPLTSRIRTPVERTVPSDLEAPGRMGRLPPEQCATLAGYTYKAMQVAVLLLAAGTMLGGLWADVSWGRFWGWDPKEVWALISLLTYLAILHGRYAGWFGNFGVAAGSVLGATAILMSWYGVNFVLGVGLHSYGFGAGGQREVGLAVIANWIFLAAAAVRYRLETGGAAGGDTPFDADDHSSSTRSGVARSTATS